MRIPMGVKILGSFGVIVFLVLGFSVSAGNRFARSEYNDFAIQRDRNRARSIAPYLSEWTSAAADATRQGRRIANSPSESLQFMSLFWDEPPPYGGSHVRGRGHRDRAEPPEFNRGESSRLMITNHHGQVLLNTTGLNTEHLDHSTGVAMKNDTEIIGYLFVGSMVPGPVESEKMPFFYSAGMRTWLFAAVIFLIAIILGFLLTKHIVGPVKTLSFAAQQVKQGALNIRVSDTRQDEMGDLARSFNAMTASLEISDIQRRQFTADAAHELRTPVSLIRSRIEMMEEKVYPMNSDNLASLARETDRIVGLIEELRTLSSLESPEFIMETSDINIAALVNRAVESYKPMGIQAGVQIDAQINISSTTIAANAEQLHRLMENLLSNAIRHAKSHIRVSVEHHGPESTRIRVDDDGQGIPPDQRERVFERFYRLDTSRNRDFGGTGLGLAICRQIVSAHDGEISVMESSEFCGASLQVILPPKNHSSGPGRKDSPKAG